MKINVIKRLVFTRINDSTLISVYSDTFDAVTSKPCTIYGRIYQVKLSCLCTAHSNSNLIDIEHSKSEVMMCKKN